MTSGSSIAGSGHTYSSDKEEDTFLKRNRITHFVRLGLSFLSFGIGIAVITCEALPLQNYKNTSQWATAGLALWPLNFDIRPTIAAISCGGIITLLSMVYIIVALLPSPYSLIKPLNIYASVSALAGFATALISVLFIIYRPSSDYPAGFNENETLHSWTCKWKTGTSGISSPSHFDRDCTSTRAAFVLLCVLVGMEALMGIVGVVGIWFQRDVSRRRIGQSQLTQLDFATKDTKDGYRN